MGQSAQIPNERRSEKRSSTHHDLTGLLKRADSDELVKCILIDISSIGIGIRSFDYLKPDTIAQITLNGKALSFRVAWSKSDSAKDSLWNIGLLATDFTVDLRSWFEQQGLMIDSSQTRGVEQIESNDPAAITFSAVRSVIAVAHTSDNSILKQPGMEKLMKEKKAFPINFKGLSLVAILPKELKPSQVNDLAEKDAELKITILKRIKTNLGDGRWVKVWPRVDL